MCVRSTWPFARELPGNFIPPRFAPHSGDPPDPFRSNARDEADADMLAAKGRPAGGAAPGLRSADARAGPSCRAS